VDPKVAFWSGALANMLVIAGLALRGLRHARRGELARHARCMRAAAALVALFLTAYVAKVSLLGREALGTWAARDVAVLRFHELCVLAMLGGGATALALARRLRRTRLYSGAAADPAAPPRVRRAHRLAGRTAITGALLGAASAAVVLAGMYARASPT
jgi:uncharacterized membrane protein YozB (DUF420 family)